MPEVKDPIRMVINCSNCAERKTIKRARPTPTVDINCGYCGKVKTLNLSVFNYRKKNGQKDFFCGGACARKFIDQKTHNKKDKAGRRSLPKSTATIEKLFYKNQQYGVI